MIPNLIQLEYIWQGQVNRLEFWKDGKTLRAFELIRITKPIEPFRIKERKLTLKEECEILLSSS